MTSIRQDIAARLAARNAPVDVEAERRIVSGFAFAGRSFQYDALAKSRITGAVLNATIAMTIGGKQPGDLRWHEGSDDYVWIATDNGTVPMDAPTVIAFGVAAATHEGAHVFAARALKIRAELPPDWRDDGYWP